MYYVIAQDGQRYGPVDLATLNQWTLDNRVVPTTTLEGQDGQRLQASAVPGIVFPAGGAPMGVPGGDAMGGAPGYGQPTGGPGFGAPGVGASGYAPYPHAGGMAFGDNGQKDVTNAYIAAAVGFFCCPVIPFIVGITLAGKALAKGNQAGNAARITNIVLLCLQVLGLAARVVLRI